MCFLVSCGFCGLLVTYYIYYKSYVMCLYSGIFWFWGGLLGGGKWQVASGEDWGLESRAGIIYPAVKIFSHHGRQPSPHQHPQKNAPKWRWRMTQGHPQLSQVTVRSYCCAATRARARNALLLWGAWRVSRARAASSSSNVNA